MTAASMPQKKRSRLPHGVTPLDQVKHLSGLEFLQGILEGRFPPPLIGAALKFELVEVEHGRAVFEGVPEFGFYNPIGVVHGGYAATLLDSCMGCAVHAGLPAGQAYTTLEFKINFVRAITDKTGAYERKNIAAGEYTGILKKEGYPDSPFTFAITENQDTVLELVIKK